MGLGVNGALLGLWNGKRVCARLYVTVMRSESHCARARSRQCRQLWAYWLTLAEIPGECQLGLPCENTACTHHVRF